MELTKQQIENLILQLKSDYFTNEVYYLGCERFVVRNGITDERGVKINVYRDRLFNEQGVEISLEDEFNAITMFRLNVAVVKKFYFLEDGLSRISKVGLIDKNGILLLPCIFDSIRISLTRFLDIKKDDELREFLLDDIIRGRFNW
jgi:hypothetical protein